MLHDAKSGLDNVTTFSLRLSSVSRRCAYSDTAPTNKKPIRASTTMAVSRARIDILSNM
ncbi:MAG: hypothetical protein U1E47_06805 [Rivihabitans pingtungensis]